MKPLHPTTFLSKDLPHDNPYIILIFRLLTQLSQSRSCYHLHQQLVLTNSVYVSLFKLLKPVEVHRRFRRMFGQRGRGKVKLDDLALDEGLLGRKQES